MSSFATYDEMKKAEMAACAGLVGKEKKAAKQAFYEANKAVIRAILDGRARAENAAREMADEATSERARSLAVSHGLLLEVASQMQGDGKWDSLVLVGGSTFSIKDKLKAVGARWNRDARKWSFASLQEAAEALAKL